VGRLVGRHLELRPRKDFAPERSGFAGQFSALPVETRMELIRSKPEYGEIICRCEHVTKHEIRSAIENPLGARTLAGIKYRARAMMGRCQGGFCAPRIVRMLRDEYGYAPGDYMMRGRGSYMFSGNVRNVSVS
jgi:glycerol-3-phosphate dehydrogenase